jgi:hypothetical protein
VGGCERGHPTRQTYMAVFVAQFPILGDVDKVRVSHVNPRLKVLQQRHLIAQLQQIDP